MLAKKTYITILLLISNLIVGVIIFFELNNSATDNTSETPVNEDPGFVGITADAGVILDNTGSRISNIKLITTPINASTFSVSAEIPMSIQLVTSINLDLVVKNTSVGNIVNFQADAIFENTLRNITKNNIINYSALSRLGLNMPNTGTMFLGNIILDSQTDTLDLNNLGSTITINGTQYNLEF